MGLCHPFIVEDGSAIFTSKDYSDGPYAYQKSTTGCHVVEFGVDYTKIRNILPLIEQETGLSLSAARRAKTREYKEVLINKFTSGDLERLTWALAERGLTLNCDSQYACLTGGDNRLPAVSYLISLYRRGRPTAPFKCRRPL
jgi:predicted mannosyl-3-phosphoglycerate phosphatase (HAD superfamily)